MDHLHHNTPLHWGYTSTPTSHQNTWVPPPAKKRALNSDSECDDIYSEESSKEHYELVDSVSGNVSTDTPVHSMSRKRRRGVIEKKRRDKINSSLTELKRLVPSAYEKQGSAKLEKAEILQLTVDHLKGLHSKGMDSLSYDPQRVAIDYHIIGFRECAAEVARYLVTIEGMDIQDPLRLRLMSHLQCFSAQREMTPKTNSNVSANSWSSSGNYHTNYPPPVPSATLSSHSASSAPSYHNNNNNNYGSASTSVNHNYIPNLSPIPVSPIQQQQQQQHCSSATTTTINTTITSHPNNNLHHDNSHQSNHYPITHDSQGGSVYTDLSASHPHRGLGYINPDYATGSAQVYPTTSGGPAYNGNSMKQPYRPWGVEMAY